MKLYFYRGVRPNFGDELNEWMWPKIIQNVWNDDNSSIFLGIGSIIFDFFPNSSRKIVFGSGYGGYTPLPKIDKNWKIYFVRGKLTARALGIDESLGIGDAAILLRSCVGNNVHKRYKVSYMPHWESTFIGNWELACNISGINYIDPCSPVETVLEKILASELVITEAMHGAIVSDALRVPWIPVAPFSNSHSMKWYDWASALEIDLFPQHAVCSSFLEELVYFSESKSKFITDKLKRRSSLVKVMPNYFADRASKSLLKLSACSPFLSKDNSIQNAHEKMIAKLDEFKGDFFR